MPTVCFLQLSLSLITFEVSVFMLICVFNLKKIQLTEITVQTPTKQHETKHKNTSAVVCAGL